LVEHFAEFILHGKPLGERPTLGSGIYTHTFAASLALPALSSERYRMAIRMGGTKTGKEVGEYLMKTGLKGDEVIGHVINFMEYCKVGKITVGKTIRMKENCESFGLETGEHCCFFTTGFLNGLFSTAKNQHVREIKCIAAGDPYCEWEII
jgi:predicted hydrocarbon binding protein